MHNVSWPDPEQSDAVPKSPLVLDQHCRWTVRMIKCEVHVLACLCNSYVACTLPILIAIFCYYFRNNPNRVDMVLRHGNRSTKAT
jgi:hypothetical protein